MCMLDTIIYTYKTPTYRIYPIDVNQKEWISKSISSIRKLNVYNVELYTNSKEFAKDLDIDTIHYINDDYLLWDSFKIHVLKSHPTNNYFLSDNDIIYHSDIKFDMSSKLMFDVFEVKNWNWAYDTTIQQLKKLDLLDTSLWDYSKRRVIGVGILSILDDVFKSKYISEWEHTYTTLKPHLHKFNLTYLTAVITQYLLTLLVESYDISYQTFSEKKYYTHYSGYTKIKGSRII